jgi:A/G-specific adenine glycosylase
MLQQTQVARVYPKYLVWLQAFPTTKKLARASTQAILKLWSGLGYNSRALRLRSMAQDIERRGAWPTTKEALQELPGFGPYTAGAVSIFAFKTRSFAIDTNIRRVLTRIFYGTKRLPTEQQLEKTAASLAQTRSNDAWHHAMMDLGALVCVSGRPKCDVCPVQHLCAAYPSILQVAPKKRALGKSVRFIDTDRFWRGRIVAFLAGSPTTTQSKLIAELRHYGELPPQRLTTILSALEKDGLLTMRGRAIRLVA